MHQSISYLAFMYTFQLDMLPSGQDIPKVDKQTDEALKSTSEVEVESNFYQMPRRFDITSTI